MIKIDALSIKLSGAHNSHTYQSCDGNLLKNNFHKIIYNHKIIKFQHTFPFIAKEISNTLLINNINNLILYTINPLLRHLITINTLVLSSKRIINNINNLILSIHKFIT